MGQSLVPPRRLQATEAFDAQVGGTQDLAVTEQGSDRSRPGLWSAAGPFIGEENSTLLTTQELSRSRQSRPTFRLVVLFEIDPHPPFGRAVTWQFDGRRDGVLAIATGSESVPGTGLSGAGTFQDVWSTDENVLDLQERSRLFVSSVILGLQVHLPVVFAFLISGTELGLSLKLEISLTKSLSCHRSSAGTHPSHR